MVGFPFPATQREMKIRPLERKRSRATQPVFRTPPRVAQRSLATQRGPTIRQLVVRRSRTIRLAVSTWLTVSELFLATQRASKTQPLVNEHFSPTPPA